MNARPSEPDLGFPRLAVLTSFHQTKSQLLLLLRIPLRRFRPSSSPSGRFTAGRQPDRPLVLDRAPQATNLGRPFSTLRPRPVSAQYPPARLPALPPACQTLLTEGSPSSPFFFFHTRLEALPEVLWRPSTACRHDSKQQQPDLDQDPFRLRVVRNSSPWISQTRNPYRMWAPI